MVQHVVPTHRKYDLDESLPVGHAGGEWSLRSLVSEQKWLGKLVWGGKGTTCLWETTEVMGYLNTSIGESREFQKGEYRALTRPASLTTTFSVSCLK